jgi:citrate synthase
MTTSDPSGPAAWSTALSETTPEAIRIRGYDLAELIGTVPFPAVVHLLYTGELPDGPTARLLDAVMVAGIDHGAGAPSALAARTAVSGGASLQAGAAAGLLTLGDHHGAAVEASMGAIATVVDAVARGRDRADAATDLVAARRAEGRRVPGFGHRQHRQRDPRLARLFALAREAGVPGDHLSAATALEAALTEAAGRPVPINVDGATAAVLGEVGFPRGLGNAVFVVARLAGILAHAEEEHRTMAPMRGVDPAGHAYCGPGPRRLPPGAGAAPWSTAAGGAP